MSRYCTQITVGGKNDTDPVFSLIAGPTTNFNVLEIDIDGTCLGTLGTGFYFGPIPVGTPNPSGLSFISEDGLSPLSGITVATDWSVPPVLNSSLCNRAIFYQPTSFSSQAMTRLSFGDGIRVLHNTAWGVAFHTFAQQPAFNAPLAPIYFTVVIEA